MGITINGNEISSLVFNGQAVSRCIYNGVLIFPELVAAATQPTTALTSNTTPSPYKVYYSSVYSNSSTYAGYKAFLNSVGTQGWASSVANKGSRAWIAMDLGQRIWKPCIQLWNRDNTSVNGPNNIIIYGTNTLPTSGTYGSSATISAMPTDAIPLGRFTGLDGSVAEEKYVLDCYGDQTSSNCTRDGNTQHRANAENFGHRYIIVASDSWNTDGGNYLAIGCIKIDGYFES